MEYTVNVKGRLMDLGRPQVMGILNVTPDSFYAASRQQTEREIADRVTQIVKEGASMIDIGACSTRPGSTPVSTEGEMERLRLGLGVIRTLYPETAVSVDTFRPEVARMAVDEYGADIINDVSGGSKDMYRMTAKLGVPYVLTSTDADLRTMLLTLAERVQQLRDFGQKDIILDPGFGFGKTLEQNYEVLRELEKLQVMELPVLVGMSRKSMIYKLLGVTAEESLTGTVVLNTVALTKGASILRVHDVREAVEAVRLFERVNSKE